MRIALVASRQFLHADDMIIPAREERRPSRGTHRLGMKIVELQSLFRKRVDMRSGHGRSIAAQIREPAIIEHDVDYAWSAHRSLNRFQHVRCGISGESTDGPLESVLGRMVLSAKSRGNRAKGQRQYMVSNKVVRIS